MSENGNTKTPPETPGEQKIPVSIEEEIRRSYLDYAMSVIVGRALPDVRDGLKPVHRRVLYGMWEQGNRHNRPYKKSARIVGDVMGKYHPHGDAAIYDTTVRMAQDFSMREPLIDGQGNFGSVDGDNPAAMRYTEIRLTKLAEELLGEDIDKETVDWTLNYDGSLPEPLVLPAKFPNLLVNGAEGIAVGMSTKIPPHNLAEVCDASILLLEEPGAGLDRLLEVLPGPDFPTGAQILGRAGIFEAYKTGRGIIQIRGRAAIETNKKTDRESIVITEIPFQVNKAKLIERMAELVNEKRIEGISAIRDESDREGMRIVIDTKRGENAQVILNQLYQLTDLQASFGIISLAIVDGQPRILSLRDCIRHFLEHRRAVVVRRTRFDLKKAEERAHLLLGLALALGNLDLVIQIIRSSKDPAEARERLTTEVMFEKSALERFLGIGELELSAATRREGEILKLDSVQAQAILDMRLQRLTGLEREKIVAEYAEILEKIRDLKDILAHPSRVTAILKEELTEIKETYGNPRRTEIVTDAGDMGIEDLIAEEEVVLTITRGGYVKRSPLSIYRAQKRGGKGRTGATAKEEDVLEHLFVASTHDYLLVFTNKGRVHWVKVYDIPNLAPSARGRALVNLIAVETGETVAAMTTTREFPDDKFLVFATKNGLVKKTVLSAYGNPRTAGIIAINLEDQDELLSVHITDGERQIFLGTRDGMAIKFSESDVRPMGRDTTGVKGIELREGDLVVEMDPVEETGTLLTVTEKGFGKRTDVAEYRHQSRGGTGVINIKVTEKNGPVVAIRTVKETDELLLITEQGMVIRIRVNDIRETGRAAMGVKLMDLDEGDRVVAIAKLEERDEDVVEGAAEGTDGAVSEPEPPGEE
ncbi:MAG: DNA gyrase subunit A [Acidobacteria bacterium]|nr:DNA gyrase subunit A [Acidobacteriota bacterium]MCG3192998.1 DNA gyrase subunit A [Thermoanaerobaculia bacterium]MCK6681350.1 DNA gyrase subunit A [Thermoanaerobaculia bacterium]